MPELIQENVFSFIAEFNRLHLSIQSDDTSKKIFLNNGISSFTSDKTIDTCKLLEKLWMSIRIWLSEGSNDLAEFDDGLM